MTLASPSEVTERLEAIEQDLARRQNAFEEAARQWFIAQREIVRQKALALRDSDRASVTEKKAEGDLAAYDVQHASAEAEYEALRAAVKVLETRATIGMSILRSQSRA